jgi:hypothetical protein
MKELKLSNGIAIVDDEDFEELSRYNWWINSYGYVASKRKIDGKWKQVRMHRIIMNPQKDEVIDHINKIKHDNRKCNLRICTQKQNSKNKSVDKDKIHSKYKGVTKDSKNNNYSARIKNDKKSIYIGTFTNEIAAANAYNYYANIYHKEYAGINECIPFMTKEEWENFKTKKIFGDKMHSKYIGVSWHKRNNKWTATIYFNNKSKSLGYFDSELDALQARNKELEKIGMTNKIQVV